MLTKDQADAAADALIQPARVTQAAHTAARRRQQHTAIRRKWLGGGALLGLASGSAVGSMLPGHPFAASIVGVIVGAGIGALVGELRARAARRG